MPRVVLDTNILISATIVPHGAPARVFAAAVAGKITLVVSDAGLTEYENVIQRRHITTKYRDIARLITDILEFLRHDSIRIYDPQTIRVVKDPKDDFLLACAIAGKANYIISGDEHLLALREYRGVKILTPRDFVVNILRESTPASR